MSAHNVLQEMNLAEFEVQDPGDGAAILVDRYNAVVPLTVAAATAETNTLADPDRAGQKVTLVAKSVGAAGSRTVTIASGVNAAGNTTALFDADDEALVLEAVPSGSSYRWLAVKADGATLS